MTHQTILELSNPLDGFAKHLGYCMAMYLIMPSSLSNPQFIVRIYGSGDVRVVDQNDIKLYGNPFIDGLNPPIPEEWQPKNK